MRTPLALLRRGELTLAWVRIAAVAFAVFEAAVTADYPGRFELWAWLTTAVFAAGALLLLVLARRSLPERRLRIVGASALVFDTAVVYAYMLVFSFDTGTPSWALLYVPAIEGALRYGIVGGVGVSAGTVPLISLVELYRSRHFGGRDDFGLDFLVLPLGLELIIAVLVGGLVRSLREETARAEARAGEAEELRDRLGRRVDLLDAANRCARALGSSLELEQAFGAFLRELRGLVPFDRVGIILSEEGGARVIAAAGTGEGVLRPGPAPIAGTLMERVLQSGEPAYRADMRDGPYPEEITFLELGLRSRLTAPLLVGARPIGIISILRRERASFGEEEVELVTLLGRLVGTTVQNIRAYDAERRTADELRRLSALRADFVSLVSHELRSPMASVIGSARTLQERWRELTPEQRESFLALIADETNRLADLIGDVLDTSRIEAGTFSYAFADVDVAALARETVAAAALGQDEVPVRAEAHEPLPRVRADRERIKQVLVNLIDNAVKHSPAGEPVDVVVSAEDGRVRVDVRDRGPGVKPEHQRLIFEKFARVKGGKAKPGTGLGLFIARSIAEAHGGSLDVRSTPDAGAVFTLTLPVET